MLKLDPTFLATLSSQQQAHLRNDPELAQEIALLLESAANSRLQGQREQESKSLQLQSLQDGMVEWHRKFRTILQRYSAEVGKNLVFEGGKIGVSLMALGQYLNAQKQVSLALAEVIDLLSGQILPAAQEAQLVEELYQINRRKTLQQIEMQKLKYVERVAFRKKIQFLSKPKPRADFSFQQQLLALVRKKVQGALASHLKEGRTAAHRLVEEYSQRQFFRSRTCKQLIDREIQELRRQDQILREK